MKRAHWSLFANGPEKSFTAEDESTQRFAEENRVFLCVTSVSSVPSAIEASLRRLVISGVASRLKEVIQYFTAEDLRAHGVRFAEDAPRHEAYGRVIVFHDLYGNKWDLIEPT